MTDNHVCPFPTNGRAVDGLALRWHFAQGHDTRSPQLAIEDRLFIDAGGSIIPFELTYLLNGRTPGRLGISIPEETRE